MKLDREYLIAHLDGTRAMNPEGTGLWAKALLQAEKDMAQQREFEFITIQRCVLFRNALKIELEDARKQLDYLLNEAPPGRLSGTALSDARARVQRLEEVLK